MFPRANSFIRNFGELQRWHSSFLQVSTIVLIVVTCKLVTLSGLWKQKTQSYAKKIMGPSTLRYSRRISLDQNVFHELGLLPIPTLTSFRWKTQNFCRNRYHLLWRVFLAGKRGKLYQRKVCKNWRTSRGSINLWKLWYKKRKPQSGRLKLAKEWSLRVLRS